ncbi:recombinase family protein [Mycoplasmatota bacterium zrk1]
MKIAIYLRISKDDEEKHESGSITNQRMYLHRYIEENLDHSEIKEYIDDGYSGTNFNRPGFNQLLEDAKNKLIDCLVIKDLSRIGRNYIEVGNYLYQVLPRLRVRIISVNENYDSKTAMETDKDLEISIYNILHDFYSKDLSRKIKSAIKAKIVNGTYRPASLPYGYEYDEDKNIVIDEPAAEVVRMILRLHKELGSYVEVAKVLNKKQILTRQDYMNHKRGKEITKQKLWTGRMVMKVINTEQYEGVAVYGKRIRKRVGIDRRMGLPKEEWISVDNVFPNIKC